MSSLKIRVYNVLFGDAFLLSVPDVDENGDPVTLRVLFDVGNALAGAAGQDDVFEAVLRDIAAELDGNPLDLYISTHEHMDHIQGLLHGKKKLGIELKAKRVWMTASSAPDYYDRFEDAKKKLAAGLAVYEASERFLAAGPDSIPLGLATLLAINNPRFSRDCVDHIRGLCETPLFVHREADIAGAHPFRRAKVRVLAPEEDTSVYYGRLGPRTLGAMTGDANPVAAAKVPVLPPSGVAAGDFFDLVRFRSSGMMGNLREIDKAANNSSVVLELEWEGWVLLFPGDAEEKSWAIMERQDLLRPAHFLKVSHHGSINGSPEEAMEKVLPRQAPDGRRRVVVVSTEVGAYSGVPDEARLRELGERVDEFHDTRQLPRGGFVDIEFAAR